MNAVEIEEAISALAAEPYDSEEFPFAFLEAFGNKATTIKRLRSGSSNKSDLGGVLQTSNIHIKTCDAGRVTEAMTALRESSATKRAKAKFILATDGTEFQAEDLNSGEVVVCRYPDFPDHFGFFLPLAGISTVKQIRESAFDIKATGRLNRLYVELLKDNPEWGTAERRHDMNHFMARLIFCFFAEDTDILHPNYGFTLTVERMSASDSSNTHEVIGEIFRAMNTKTEDKAKANLPRWVDGFPYVNGGLFSGSTEVPRFSRIARSYLLHIGNLDWKQINPDIFGSMIQAVADDEERGALGMHYTSVPNILKVLNPLFLDDLREKLDEAGDNTRKLRNLRNRMARIRVFDPACGSGNFLVIAYKEMRAIEAEINKRCGDADRRTEIPLTNFRGIELRDFPAEIARLALIIAEYQCDVLYRGQKEALAEFLPLDAKNWITCGNALRLDWLSICPPIGTGAKHHADDLFMSPLDQSQIDFENEGGETYICGNPPFSGLTKQKAEQKEDLKFLFSSTNFSASSVDYVAGWYFKAKQYNEHQPCRFAFVSTNSMCQGQMVPKFWKPFLTGETKIRFAHTSFLWKNLAKNNAGVIVVIVGVDTEATVQRYLFKDDICTATNFISPYLTTANVDIVSDRRKPIHQLPDLIRGSIPNCGGNLVLSASDARQMFSEHPAAKQYLRRYVGAQEISKGMVRFALLISDDQLAEARAIPEINQRILAVKEARLNSTKETTRSVLSNTPHRYELVSSTGEERSVAVSRTTSENREYLATDLLPRGTIANDNAFFSEREHLLIFSVLVSRCHLAWIATVCGRMKNDYRYANTLGWNTFPLPKLTEKNKEDLTCCAEDILLAREAHFPATITDLYEVKDGESQMPEDLRSAHDRNDETLERIYIGRRFRNDTERLEKLFELYTKMTKQGVA
ncbi:DNA methyltransferase [Thalassospira sp. MCCC 1A02491]|uniref:class I SAM-dependent DNA methyltransferase n=1 Tax=Thalassospira sp. MCCC 1A02491 TaxID=1769751 RepID=UPI0007AD6EF1|nr:DNA methyltransferase [Thalassospira sp. MCCC 1A02491]KZB67198.1 lactate dehydrogenase [Thalassospira sp. MCCC 1A02491]